MQGHKAVKWSSGLTISTATNLWGAWTFSGSMLQAAVRKLQATAVDAWDLVRPGGKLHPQEFIEHNGDVLVQLLLVAVSVYLLLQNRFKPSAKGDAPLTEQVSKPPRAASMD